jgi:hypothetical protein
VLVFHPLARDGSRPGQSTAIAFRFTARGAVKIDDVYVDPFKGF